MQHPATTIQLTVVVVGQDPDRGTTRIRIVGTSWEMDVPGNGVMRVIADSCDDVLSVRCIEVLDGQRMTVAGYDAVLHQRQDQPIWARTATPAARLTGEPAKGGARVINPVAYEVQMLRLLGLE